MAYVWHPPQPKVEVVGIMAYHSNGTIDFAIREVQPSLSDEEKQRARAKMVPSGNPQVMEAYMPKGGQRHQPYRVTYRR